MTSSFARFGLGLGAFLALWLAAMAPVYGPAMAVPLGNETLVSFFALLLGAGGGFLFLRAEGAAVQAAGDVALVDEWKRQLAWAMGLATGLHLILVVLALPVFLRGPGRALVAFSREGEIPILQLVSDPILALFYLFPLLPPLTLLLLVPMLASQRQLGLSLASLHTINVAVAGAALPLALVAFLQMTFAGSEFYQILRRLVEQAASR